jgi:long-chain acyl-CoA synthetase
MCILPFYYVYGLSLLNTHVKVGGSLVIENRSAYPNVVLAGIREHRVTGFAGVPSTFTLLLERSTVREMEFPTLRYVTQAGGAMAPARVLEWLEHGPRVPFYVMYGATEAAARLTYLPPSETRTRLGSIGRPVPNVEIIVRRDDGTVASPREVGELVARGSNIAAGYWNAPAETAAKFGAFGYRTGDLGYADEDGYLFLVGRSDDMIKVGGHRIGPKEIEDVIHDHPEVVEAAVLGYPDSVLGEVPVAFVVSRGTTSADSILQHCGSRLSHHKVPTRVVFVQELPKIAGIGKIDRRTLREQHSPLPANR